MVWWALVSSCKFSHKCCVYMCDYASKYKKHMWFTLGVTQRNCPIQCAVSTSCNESPLQHQGIEPMTIDYLPNKNISCVSSYHGNRQLYKLQKLYKVARGVLFSNLKFSRPPRCLLVFSSFHDAPLWITNQEMPQKQTHLTYPIKILLILKIPVFISHNSGILGLLSTQRTGCNLDVTFFTKSAVCLSFLRQHGRFPQCLFLCCFI